MLPPKRNHPKEKSSLHPRNRHRERYDFRLLIESCPQLAGYVRLNDYNDESIDFFNPDAVKMLNKALLKHYYNIENWDVPKGYLCPPIPGRADYIHYVADLLGSKNNGEIPAGEKIRCLDIGTGANCVYPLIGNNEYGWSFVGSDIDALAIDSAKRIIESNPFLAGKIELRFQPDAKNIFKGIVLNHELFDVTVCNPPFHSSLAEARAGTLRKLSNLTKSKASRATLNFGGQNAELWCDGGEEQFVCTMVSQSRSYATSCFWFTALVSRESSLKSIYEALRESQAAEVKTIAMGQGNKISRLVAWTFLSPQQQAKWKAERWDIKP